MKQILSTCKVFKYDVVCYDETMGTFKVEGG
jgi:hypothetical protein